jgi:glycogen debranching enzyme
MKCNCLILRLILSLACVSSVTESSLAADQNAATISVTIPTLETDQAAVNEAFRIAGGDLLGNVVLFQSGLLEHPSPVILAGLDYDRPWTRDASINAWNGASLLMPDVSRNTLISVLTSVDGKPRIGGQYWDSIVWTTGSWHHYLYTGDKRFLALALETTKNSLAFLEQTEFDPEDGLFRGPASTSDGVAAYPDQYASPGCPMDIMAWPGLHPDKASKPGYGIPMKALSTNCLYYNAYVVAERMATELSTPVDPQWQTKAAKLKQAINSRLWNGQKGCYRILIDPLGKCDHQEGLGSSYAVLFGVADAEQAESVFATQYVAPAGIPCGWPSYGRYQRREGTSFGRHCATVWPPVQGFWAEAAARTNRPDLFAHEFHNLAAHAARDKQFAEIYHPVTGEIYGGLQEDGQRGIVEFRATSRQTWSATAYLRMVLLGLVGLRFDTDGVRFQPCVPEDISSVELGNVHYRNMILDVAIHGTGTKIKQCLVNGRESKDGFVAASGEGHQRIVVTVQNQ